MYNTSRLGKILYHTLEWLMNLLVINLNYLLFNLPIVYLVFDVLLFGVNSITLIIIAILLVLLLFPATTAMYASIRECVIHVPQRASFKKFWLFYKRNYFKSVIVGFIMVPLWGLWSFNVFYFFQSSNIALLICFLFIGLLYFVYNVNLFIVHVHYHNKLKSLFLNTLYITFGSIKLFLSIVISFVFVSSISILISKLFFSLFIIFFSGSLFALISFSFFYQDYLRVTENQEGSNAIED